VKWIAQTLEDAGHETWAVGGAIRDVLVGIPSGDWDLTTHARPAQVRKMFRRTVPIGIEHGTVGVLAKDGAMYEVTTFRKDVETDGRHAVVAFAEHVEDDLGRRDFTINAIAWHPLREEFFDPFEGLGDLEDRLLRTVGEPEERFREDYLRILRALRFAGRFHLRIDAATWTALRSMVENVRALSAERIRDELLKVLDQDPTPSTAVGLYADCGVLDVLYPELAAIRAEEKHPPGADPWGLCLATIDELPRGRPLQRLAALLRGLEADATASLLMRLRLSNANVDEVARRAGAAPLPPPESGEPTFRHWLSREGVARLAALSRIDLARAKVEAARGLGTDPLEVVRSWRKARAVRSDAPPLSVGDLAVDGRALIALGLSPGPHFGEILDDLLQWVLDDPDRNRPEDLERRAREVAAGLGADG
jgi:tRNA nucleotidyltransferase/poly(A) polymerase